MRDKVRGRKGMQKKARITQNDCRGSMAPLRLSCGHRKHSLLVSQLFFAMLLTLWGLEHLNLTCMHTPLLAPSLFKYFCEEE